MKKILLGFLIVSGMNACQKQNSVAPSPQVYPTYIEIVVLDKNGVNLITDKTVEVTRKSNAKKVAGVINDKDIYPVAKVEMRCVADSTKTPTTGKYALYIPLSLDESITSSGMVTIKNSDKTYDFAFDYKFLPSSITQPENVEGVIYDVIRKLEYLSYNGKVVEPRFNLGPYTGTPITGYIVERVPVYIIQLNE